MTLDQLRIFLAIVAEGGMTHAAKRLNMTQSAVSAAISSLETRYQLRLFDRLGRGLALTPEGETFYPAARAVLAQAETAQLLLADLAQETRGLLRLHASQTVANYWLPPHLVSLHERHPGIEIKLAEENTAAVARAVLEGRGDIGLVEGEIETSLLIRKVVDRDELVLVGAKGNRRLTAPRLERADYLEMVWILREEGSGTRAEFERHLAQMGLTLADLQIAFEIPSNAAALSAVEAGGYVTMLSLRAVQQSVGVQWRAVDWTDPPRRNFTLLLHPDRHRTRAMQALLQQLDAAQP